jgi:hypothetical protein
MKGKQGRGAKDNTTNKESTVFGKNKKKCNNIPRQSRTYIFSTGADELDAGENKVSRAVKVEAQQPRMCGVNEAIIAAECTHLVGNVDGAREVLVEVDVENVVDEAGKRNAVVS